MSISRGRGALLGDSQLIKQAGDEWTWSLAVKWPADARHSAASMSKHTTDLLHRKARKNQLLQMEEESESLEFLFEITAA